MPIGSLLIIRLYYLIKMYCPSLGISLSWQSFSGKKSLGRARHNNIKDTENKLLGAKNSLFN